MTNNNQLPPGVTKFLTKNFLKIELVLALAIFIGLLLKYANIPHSATIIAISAATLGILYFLGGFQPPDDNEKSFFGIIAFKVLHISWAVETVGLLFLLMQYPGAMNMVGIGSTSNLIALILLIAVSLNNWTARKTQAVLRSLVILLLLLVTYMM